MTQCQGGRTRNDENCQIHDNVFDNAHCCLFSIHLLGNSRSFNLLWSKPRRPGVRRRRRAAIARPKRIFAAANHRREPPIPAARNATASPRGRHRHVEGRPSRGAEEAKRGKRECRRRRKIAVRHKHGKKNTARLRKNNRPGRESRQVGSVDPRPASDPARGPHYAVGCQGPTYPPNRTHRGRADKSKVPRSAPGTAKISMMGEGQRIADQHIGAGSRGNYRPSNQPWQMSRRRSQTTVPKVGAAAAVLRSRKRHRAVRSPSTGRDALQTGPSRPPRQAMRAS